MTAGEDRYGLRTVVADDDVIVREGVAAIVRALGHLVVGLAGSFDETMSVTQQTAPDVVLLDIRMPPTHTTEGLQAAAMIRKNFPATAAIVLSQFLAADYAVRLLDEADSGVGYLLKADAGRADRLGQAMQAVARGETVVDSGVVERLTARSVRSHRLDALSDRELELLTLVAEGFSNRAIAVRLGLSERTVNSHIASIMRKLDLSHGEDVNRRVRAVLLYLNGRGDDFAPVY